MHFFEQAKTVLQENWKPDALVITLSTCYAISLLLMYYFLELAFNTTWLYSIIIDADLLMVFILAIVYVLYPNNNKKHPLTLGLMFGMVYALSIIIEILLLYSFFWEDAFLALSRFLSITLFTTAIVYLLLKKQYLNMFIAIILMFVALYVKDFLLEPLSTIIYGTPMLDFTFLLSLLLVSNIYQAIFYGPIILAAIELLKSLTNKLQIIKASLLAALAVFIANGVYLIPLVIASISDIQELGILVFLFNQQFLGLTLVLAIMVFAVLYYLLNKQFKEFFS